MNNTLAAKPNVQMFALVRDKNGKPRIDGDPKDLPEPITALLTDAERRELLGEN